jgi:hypothetical protein
MTREGNNSDKEQAICFHRGSKTVESHCAGRGPRPTLRKGGQCNSLAGNDPGDNRAAFLTQVLIVEVTCDTFLHLQSQQCDIISLWLHPSWNILLCWLPLALTKTPGLC